MQDLLYVAILVVLTLIGIAFVIGCDKIVGPDDREVTARADKQPEPQHIREEVTL